MTYDGMPISNEGGLLMQGTWFNRTTGDSFTVADMYFEDNNPRVKTTDGRVLDYNIVQNYIQVDPADLKMLKQQAKEEQQVKKQPRISLGNLKASEDTTDDYTNIMSEDPLFQRMPASVQSTNPYYTEKKSPNAAMIDKALKHQSIPEMTPSFEWNNFPKKQLDALIDVMEVPTDEIVDYVYAEMMGVMGDELKKQVKDYIISKINSK